jgi:hypothetical protein
LSYGYARSELGQKAGRPRTTETWLSLLGVAAFVIAIGLLAMPHGTSFREMYAEMTAGSGRSMFALGAIAVGLVFAIIGLVAGSRRPVKS